MPRYQNDYGSRYSREFEGPWIGNPRGRPREGWRSRGRRPGYGRREFGGRRDFERYDRPYLGYGVGRAREERGGWGGYGRGYRKTRWETDHGDPFRDRERGTPIRMTRGRWQGYGRGDYGREHFGERQSRRGYGEEFEFRPREHRSNRLRRF